MLVGGVPFPRSQLYEVAPVEVLLKVTTKGGQPDWLLAVKLAVTAFAEMDIKSKKTSIKWRRKEYIYYRY
jgi:hypothetical protein